MRPASSCSWQTASFSTTYSVRFCGATSLPLPLPRLLPGCGGFDPACDRVCDGDLCLRTVCKNLRSCPHCDEKTFCGECDAHDCPQCGGCGGFNVRQCSNPDDLWMHDACACESFRWYSGSGPYIYNCRVCGFDLCYPCAEKWATCGRCFQIVCASCMLECGCGPDAASFQSLSTFRISSTI